MRIFFSPSTRGFYTDEIHGEAMPADVQRISPGRHRQLLEAQAAGAEIIATAKGPVARFPKATLEILRAAAIAAVKREARRRILAIAPLWRQLNDLASLVAPGCYSAEDEHCAMERRQKIDDVRAASGRLEARLVTLSAEQLADVDVADDSHWSSPHEG